MYGGGGGESIDFFQSSTLNEIIARRGRSASHNSSIHYEQKTLAASGEVEKRKSENMI